MLGCFSETFIVVNRLERQVCARIAVDGSRSANAPAHHSLHRSFSSGFACTGRDETGGQGAVCGAISAVTAAG